MYWKNNVEAIDSDRARFRKFLIVDNRTRPRVEEIRRMKMQKLQNPNKILNSVNSLSLLSYRRPTQQKLQIQIFVLVPSFILPSFLFFGFRSRSQRGVLRSSIQISTWRSLFFNLDCRVVAICFARRTSRRRYSLHLRWCCATICYSASPPASVQRHHQNIEEDM